MPVDPALRCFAGRIGMGTGTARRRAGTDAIGIDPAARGKIGAQLRAAYEDLSRQPLPNEHVDLLLALRRKERELKQRQ
jgi:hypothetical protein